jgi:small-conductance mechanosensitive channel
MAQIHSILNDRVESEKQLSAVYANWIAQVQLQHRIVMHMILQSVAGIAGLVLGAVLVWWVVQMLLDRAATGSAGMDKRSVHTLRTIASLLIQLVTLVLILLVVFGVPNQVPTILGLGAAGLTVVFQDFILAFFGWFVLMGRNGIRVGDWVEINGVGGEVVEIGLFRTALLETGNWTDKGHPTGRRVTFGNSFAIEGHYFNFSTSGQWLWDEVRIVVPAGQDPYPIVDAVQKQVEEATADSAREAERQWKGAERSPHLSALTAAPAVNIKPIMGGIEITVRYITHMGERSQLRAKLYHTAVDLLGGKHAAPPLPTASPTRGAAA